MLALFTRRNARTEEATLGKSVCCECRQSGKAAIGPAENHTQDTMREVQAEILDSGVAFIESFTDKKG